MDIASALLVLGWRFVVLWADNVSLSYLDGAGCHAVIPTMVGSWTPYTVHQLFAILHDGIPGVVTRTCVASVVWTAECSCYPCLWPKWCGGKTLIVVPLTTTRHSTLSSKPRAMDEGLGWHRLHLHHHLVTVLLTQETLMPRQLALGALE